MATELSPREIEILSKGLACLKSDPEVDFDALATSLGMKNVRSASNAWRNARKKLQKLADGNGVSDGAAGGAEAEDGSDGATATPAKKRKKTAGTGSAKKTAAPVKKEEIEKEAGEEAGDDAGDD